MKKITSILSVALVLLLMLSSFAMSASAAEFRDYYEEPEYFFGDTDFDGRVSVKDATAIQKHLAKIITLSENALYFGDVDGNEKNTISDATLIQKYVAKMIDIFPVEEIFADYYCNADGEVVSIELNSENSALVEITVEEAGFYNVSAAIGGETDIFLEIFSYESGESWLVKQDGETAFALVKLEAGTYYGYMYIEDDLDTTVQFKVSPTDDRPFDIDKAQELNIGDQIQITAGTETLVYQIDISQIETQGDELIVYTEGENPLVSIMCYDANYGFNSEGYDDGMGNTTLTVYNDEVNDIYYVVVTQAEGGSDFTLCCNTSFGILKEEAKDIELGTVDEIVVEEYVEEIEGEIVTFYSAQAVYKFVPAESGYYSFNFESGSATGIMAIIADLNAIEESYIYIDMIEAGGRLFDVRYLEAGVEYYIISIVDTEEAGNVIFTILNSTEEEYLEVQNRYPFEDATPDETVVTEITVGETVEVFFEATDDEIVTEDFVFTAEEDCTVVLYSENSADACVYVYDENYMPVHMGDDIPLFESMDFTIIGNVAKGETVYFSLSTCTTDGDSYTFTLINEADYVPLG